MASATARAAIAAAASTAVSASPPTTGLTHRLKTTGGCGSKPPARTGIGTLVAVSANGGVSNGVRSSGVLKVRGRDGWVEVGMAATRASDNRPSVSA